MVEKTIVELTKSDINDAICEYLITKGYAVSRIDFEFSFEKHDIEGAKVEAKKCCGECK